MTIYAFMYSFSYLEPVCGSMSSSNCCFPTCIQVRLDQIFARDQVFAHRKCVLTSCRAPISKAYWDPSSNNNYYVPDTILDFPNGSMVKNLPANAGDVGSVLRLGRSPGEGNGNPIQESCLGNPTDRGAWWAIVRWVARVRHDWATKPQTRLHIMRFVYFRNSNYNLSRLTLSLFYRTRNKGSVMLSTLCKVP